MTSEAAKSDTRSRTPAAERMRLYRERRRKGRRWCADPVNVLRDRSSRLRRGYLKIRVPHMIRRQFKWRLSSFISDALFN